MRLTRVVRALIGAGLASALAAPLPARADIGSAGTSVAGFLVVPPGASGPGMAGTTLALSGDLSAAASNPAALGGVPAFALALAHSELPDGSRHEWLSLGGKLGPLATRWGLSGLYAGQGSFEGRDASNQPTSNFTASSSAFGIALAQPLARVATLGLGAQLVSEDLAGTRGTGVTFDGGLLVHAGPIGLGASAQNVSGGMTYGGTRYPFPASYGAGLAVEHRGLRLEVDANFPTDYYNDVRAGMEYRWRDRFALRAGYRRELGADPTLEPLDGPSFGVGAGVHGLWFDYAYLPSAAGATEQRLGLVLMGGRPGFTGGELEQKRAPEPAPPPAPSP